TVLIKSLNRIGNTMSSVEETFSQMDRTLAGMDRSNQATATTMQELGSRVTESDRFMNETFSRLRESEREFTEHVSRASRRSQFAMMAVCSILLLSVVAVGFMFKENRELLSAVQHNGALVVQVPSREQPERVVLFEDLEQVDDGIGEPDREIVAAPPEIPGIEPGVPVSLVEEPGAALAPESLPEIEPAASGAGEGSTDSLLSVNELPRRE
ncbi:MAG: hypothetical protein GWO24_21475, partial [Akkermansiaceae bacterium]|nr:hypothetical protein [Akkermansiaceae bacterium]